MYVDKKNLKGFREPTDDEHNQILLRYGDKYTKAITACMMSLAISLIAAIMSLYTIPVGIIAILLILKVKYADLHLGSNINKRQYKVVKCNILNLEQHGEIGQGYHNSSTVITIATEFDEICYNRFGFDDIISNNEELLLITDGKIYETVKIGKL